MFNWLLKRLPSFTIENAAGQPYLRRYYLLKTKRLGIYIHEILRSDEDRDLHDHPWNFLSIVLRHGYIELFPNGEYKCRFPRSWVFHRAEDAHKVELYEKPAWTLVFVGRKRREWGFHTSDGWVHWQDYLDRKYGVGKWKQEPEYQGLTKETD